MGFAVLSVLLTLVFSVRADYNLVVLHTNDVHARVGETNAFDNLCNEEESAGNQCYAGVARRFTKINEVRGSHDNVLLLDGGDQFQGSVWFTYYGGIEASYFMNRLGYDASALGNNEFAHGVTGLEGFLQNVSFPILSANLDVSKEKLIKDYIRPSVVKVLGGQKIAIIGYTTRNLKEYVYPDGVANLVLKDEVEEIRKEAKRLMVENPDLNKIIALGSSGHEMDKTIAYEVEEVDIVVGGHSHTFLYNGDPPTRDVPVDIYPVVVTKKSGVKALVVMASSFGKYLGFLDVVFDDSGDVKSWSGNPIFLGPNVPQDAVLLADVLKWAAPLKNLTQQVVGETYVYLEGEAKTCWRSECSLGNLLTDAVLFSIRRRPEEGSWTRAALAFWNSGGIRAPIPQGLIRIGDILASLPFSHNEIELLDIKGSLLFEIFENSISRRGGRFLQVSGFRVTYDVSRAVNNRVTELLVLCSPCNVPRFEPVDPDQVYTVVTNSFLYAGGDGFSMLKDGATKLFSLGTTYSDAVLAYVQQHPPIVQGIEGRITVTNGTAEGQSCTGNSSIPMWSPILVISALITLFVNTD